MNSVDSVFLRIFILLLVHCSRFVLCILVVVVVLVVVRARLLNFAADAALAWFFRRLQIILSIDEMQISDWSPQDNC